ncbi:hypothetical protein D9M72_513510 [compost metagenome]
MQPVGVPGDDTLNRARLHCIEQFPVLWAEFAAIGADVVVYEYLRHFPTKPVSDFATVLLLSLDA